MSVEALRVSLEALRVYLFMAWAMACLLSAAAVPILCTWLAATGGASWKGALAISIGWLGLSLLLVAARASVSMLEPAPASLPLLSGATLLYPLAAAVVSRILWRRWRAA